MARSSVLNHLLLNSINNTYIQTKLGHGKDRPKEKAQKAFPTVNPAEGSQRRKATPVLQEKHHVTIPCTTLQSPSPSFLLTGANFWYKQISALFDKACGENLVVNRESKSRNAQARAMQGKKSLLISLPEVTLIIHL